MESERASARALAFRNMRVLSLALVFSLMAPQARIVSFDGDPQGKSPSGWTFVAASGSASPEWEVRREQTSTENRHVLARMSPSADSAHPALALLNSMSLRDGELSVRVKPVAGARARSGGLIFRYRDPENYYLARADAVKQDVAIFRFQNGRRIQLGEVARHALPADAWRILKVTARGDRLQVYLDHRRALEVFDRGYTGAGLVGLWSEADSVAYFDDFRITPK
jgi:hypothetical protein